MRAQGCWRWLAQTHKRIPRRLVAAGRSQHAHEWRQRAALPWRLPCILRSKPFNYLGCTFHCGDSLEVWLWPAAHGNGLNLPCDLAIQASEIVEENEEFTGRLLQDFLFLWLHGTPATVEPLACVGNSEAKQNGVAESVALQWAGVSIDLARSRCVRQQWHGHSPNKFQPIHHGIFYPHTSTGLSMCSFVTPPDVEIHSFGKRL